MAEKNIGCPHCGQELSIEEQYLGMEVECPTCHKTFVASSQTEQAISRVENTGIAENVDESGTSQKNKLQRLLSKAKTTLGSAYSTTKGKLNSELSEVRDDAEKTQAREDVVPAEKAFDEDNPPEPDPGFVDDFVEKKEFFKPIKSVIKTPPVRYGCGGIIVLFFCTTFLTMVLLDGRGPWWERLLQWLAVCLASLIFLSIVFLLPYCLYFFGYRLFGFSGHRRRWKRDLVREYFSVHIAVETGLNLFEKLMDFVEGSIPFINTIPMIVNKIAQAKRDEYCRFREPFYDEVRELDMDYLEKINVLSRFGKSKEQLVSPMQTLFSPAFDGVSGLRRFQSVVSKEDNIYRYNLEEVTKVYTFEDQLFIYTGVWAYALGKMISEKTEAFFFKDITDIKTESNFKIHKKYEPKGCLSILIPWLGKPIETVYKESESFVLTASSGNPVGRNIGFEDAIAVTGATYTRRNDNEKIIHAIRKMIEEKKVAAQ